jgi:peptidoglycan hydrolase-like protein with peptidoglycan-binding domain
MNEPAAYFSRRALVASVAATGAALLVPRAAAGTIDGASRTLAYGARGRDVLELNELLAHLTVLPAAAVSSVFGEATHLAVLAFQKLARLEVDGVVGRRTRTALDRAEPPRPRTRGQAARIEISLEQQLAFVASGSEVVRTVAVSTGRPGFATPRGTFRIYRRDRRSWSVPYGVWLPWAAYFNRGIALHGHEDVPAYAASHGCVRIPNRLAREVYGFARIGTRVTVL